MYMPSPLDSRAHPYGIAASFSSIDSGAADAVRTRPVPSGSGSQPSGITASESPEGICLMK